jgi:hypothetical protein
LAFAEEPRASKPGASLDTPGPSTAGAAVLELERARPLSARRPSVQSAALPEADGLPENAEFREDPALPEPAVGRDPSPEASTVRAADARDFSRAWPEIVAALLQSKPALGAVLQHGIPLEIGPQRIALGFERGSFFGKQAESLDAKSAVAEVAGRVLGTRPRIDVVYGETATSAGRKTLAQEQTEHRDALVSATQRKALEHPVVLAVGRMFGIPRERMTIRVELE